MGLVATFFRSPVTLGRDQRSLFRRSPPESAFLEGLRRSPFNLRDNVARIFVAARLASEHRTPLLFVEGWRGQAIARPGGGTRHVTGSYVSRLLMKGLQRRQLVGRGIRVLREDVSRCTAEEVAGIERATVLIGASRVIGIAGRACPSRRRAARYFGLQSSTRVTVYDCWRELRARCAEMTPEQRHLASALWPAATERVRETSFEAANWLLHWASRFELSLRRPSLPLEVRLAHRLRPDRRR